MGGFAWVTLATNDSYSLGALVLAHSLKAVGTVHQLAVLVTPGVTNAMREKLSAIFNLVQEVNILDSRDETNLRLLKRPELGITFTKLHCWRLTQFEKCVFLDADTLVLQYSDELFDREELSAAPDVGWPDCFNSGVYVYRPSLETYDKLIQFALEKGSFDGGDQGLLNLYFSDWAHKDISRHLPFIYNMCSTACYSYLPAFKQFGSNAKIIHFIGAQKPWLQYFNTETRKVQPSGDSSHLEEVLQRWWDIFCSLIHPHLSPEMPQQLQRAVSPSYFPPQYAPSPNPTSSADDYENAWDPWDEYDKKIAQSSHYTSVSTHNIQNQPIESLNTNASHVADQPTIHSQPQSHNYNTYSAQNNSFFQPIPIPIYQHVPRVPTPPPSPQPQHQHYVPQNHQHHQTQYHHDESQSQSQPQYHHDESQSQSQPQYHHDESQSQSQPQFQHQEHSHLEAQFTHHHHQHHHVHTHQNPPSHHQEPLYEHFQHTDNHQHTNHPQEQSYHQTHHSHSHQTKPESFSPDPDHPRSPNRPDPVPILPKECEATTTVSNDMSLSSSTIEDYNKQDNAGLAGAFAQLTLGVARTPEQDAFENVIRKQAWEVGNIDYLGKDSFDNIWSKISETLSTAPASEPVKASTLTVEPEPTAPAQSQTESAPPQEEAKPVQSPVTPVETAIDTTTSTSAVEASKDQQKTPLESPVAPKSPETVESEKSEPQIIETPKVSEELKEVSQPLPEVSPATKETESVAEPEVLLIIEKEEAKEVETKASEPQTEAPKAESKDPDVPVIETKVPEPKVDTPVIETKASEPQTGVPEKPKESATEAEASSLLQEKVEKADEPEVPKQIEAVQESVCTLPAKKEAPEETGTQVITSELDKTQSEVPSLQPDVPKETLPKKDVPKGTPQSQESPTKTPQAQETAAESSLATTKKPKTTSQPPPQTTALQQPEAVSESSEISALSATTPKEDVKPTAKAVPVAPASKGAPTDSKVVKKVAPSKDSPKTKVTEATPPATPGSPLLEKTKEALAAEASIPDTPPPTEGGSTPTPPPRKTDKPKKVAAKPKK